MRRKAKSVGFIYRCNLPEDALTVFGKLTAVAFPEPPLLLQLDYVMQVIS